MAINKFVLGNEVKFDLTADTVEAAKLLRGYTAHDKAGEPITGTCDFDVNSADATAAVAEVLADKTFYARGARLTGTMPNRGAVSATVQEGDTYTIPAGYHNGSGTVSGVAGGGNYKLQSKTVAPTKSQQAITPDSGYYGLSDVTVSQIPDAYQDVSSVTAGAADTLTGKVLVTADGKVATGTMPNNGAVSKALDAGTPSYTIPKGYHSGAGKVSVAVETKTVTPTKAAQDIVPSTGKVLTKVSVAAIPDAFADTSGADALAANILDGKTAFVNGVKVTGSMPDNGSATATMDGLTTTSVTIPAGYTAGGTVSLTADIEEALAAI